jgi:hypothetical protein
MQTARLPAAPAARLGTSSARRLRASRAPARPAAAASAAGDEDTLDAELEEVTRAVEVRRPSVCCIKSCICTSILYMHK